MDIREKKSTYRQIINRIDALIEGQTDLISILSTVVCELHHGFSYFHWTGFYRVTGPDMLHVGPYQGGHGCLFIPFSKGICGQAARNRETVILGDVNRHENHIACSSTTVSEIVVPLYDQQNNLLAVLDVDSDLADAFDETDKQHLEEICGMISQKIRLK